MKNVANKANNVDTLDAKEFNSLMEENENAVLASGQSLDNTGSTTTDPDKKQLAKTLTMAAQTADFYSDSGTADAYILTIVGDWEKPASLRNGQRVRFTTTNENTGASTVNVSSYGVKNIVKEDGTGLTGGEIGADRIITLTYLSGPDVFMLQESGAGSGGDGLVLASATDTTRKTLTEKLLTSSSFTKTLNNGGGDETITVSAKFADQATVEAGTDEVEFVNSLGVKQAIDAQAVRSDFYENTTGGSVAGSTLNTFAHGLGAVPKLVLVYIKCIVASEGFAVGDNMLMGFNGCAISASNWGFSTTFDDTNIVVKMGNNGTQAFSRADDAFFNVPAANWELYVRAFV